MGDDVESSGRCCSAARVLTAQQLTGAHVLYILRGMPQYRRKPDEEATNQAKYAKTTACGTCKLIVNNQLVENIWALHRACTDTEFFRPVRRADEERKKPRFKGFFAEQLLLLTAMVCFGLIDQRLDLLLDEFARAHGKICV